MCVTDKTKRHLVFGVNSRGCKISGRLVVGIVSFNSGHLLKQCLDCLAVQTRRPDEIRIYDNASTDPETLKYLGLLNSCNVTIGPKNIGYGAALNRIASDLEAGDYLFCLNPDAYVESDCLENLMASVSRYPEAGSYAPLMLSATNSDLIDDAGDELHCSGNAWQRWFGKPVDSVVMYEEPIFGPCGGACLLRVEAFLRVGGFDESYFLFVEDTDLGLRLQLAGFKCWFIPEARVRHHRSALTGFQSELSVSLTHRNTLWMMLKNFPLWFLPVALIMHLLVLFMLTIQMLTRGQSKILWMAKWEALRSLPAVWRCRTKVIRELGAWQFLRLLRWMR